LTKRNLYSTVQQVNFSDPLGSPLLTLPTAPHGTATEKIFGEYDRRQYESLVEWVRAVSQKDEPRPPQSINRPDGHLLQAMSIERPVLPRSSAKSTAPEEPNPISPAATLPQINVANSNKVAEPVDQSQNDTSFLAADPFDPEIFNRRYLDAPNRQAARPSAPRSTTEIQRSSKENSPR
jgi:hypothetical protein